MSRRVRRPAVSFAMFMVVAAVGFVVWENRHELKGQPEHVILEREVREHIEEEILTALDRDSCFVGLRGHISWRPNEGRYRLDIEINDGAGCESKARGLCEQVARIVRERTNREATVSAFDGAGREVARCIL